MKLLQTILTLSALTMECSQTLNKTEQIDSNPSSIYHFSMMINSVNATGYGALNNYFQASEFAQIQLLDLVNPFCPLNYGCFQF